MDAEGHARQKLWRGIRRREKDEGGDFGDLSDQESQSFSSPRACKEKTQDFGAEKSPKSPIQPDDTADNGSRIKLPDGVRQRCTDTLLMDPDDTISLWEEHGKPTIQLRPGERCNDLRKLLSRRDLRDSDFQAVRAWLDSIRELS